MADFLLMHPKGAAIHDGYTFEEPTEADPTITCTEEPYTYIPPVIVECPAEEADPIGCYDYCQFSADCVEWDGLAPGPQMSPQRERTPECGAASSMRPIASQADDPVLTADRGDRSDSPRV